MLFRKRDRKDNIPPDVRQRVANTTRQQTPEFFPIEFDMMIKGNIVQRKRSTIRQYCVTVNGTSRLVNSGDIVDRKTYDALLAAGAIRSIPSEPLREETSVEPPPDDRSIECTPPTQE